jgi:protein-tyrosine phosphatase
MRIKHLLGAFSALTCLVQPLTGAQAQTAVQAAPANPSHQRVLPLEGGQNFRDLGGYRTADGRHVKWGKLFRSGSPKWLTAADYRYLEGRGIRVVCDFRSTGERQHEPYAWPASRGPRMLADDYEMSQAGIMPPMRADMTPEQAKRVMTDMYPQILSQFGSQYRRMFQELLAGHAPLAFNCSAGKDRTGIAAALILTALGVPRQTVIEDYTLSNRYFDARRAATSHAGGTADWGGMQPEAMKQFMLADPSYIEAAFEVIDGHAGGVNGYLHDELGLSAADLARLHRLYTE